nr:SpaA isopeptide-forming pilin-related protein [Arcanobacterium phocae]
MAGGKPWVPSLTLKKNVLNRVEEKDQFELSVAYNSGIHAGKPLHVSTVTTGNKGGVQKEVAGPVLVASGDSLVVSEALNREGNIKDYDPQLKCLTANNVPVKTSELEFDGKKVSAVIDLAGKTFDDLDIDCTFTNGSYKATVKKVNQDGRLLSGAVLKLWRDIDGDDSFDPSKDEMVKVAASGPENPFTTTGVAFEWQGLRPGTYFVEEISAPTGYLKRAEAIKFVIVDKNVEVKVENAPARGNFSWEKVDEKGEQHLDNSSWHLVGKDDQQKSVYNQYITDNSGLDSNSLPGYFTVENLPIGSYTLSESIAPNGYQKTDKEFTFEVKLTQEGNVEVTDLYVAGQPVDSNQITNMPLKGTLKFEKVAENTGKKLSGSEWNLSGTDGSIKIVDCTQAPCDLSTHDVNPEPGVIEVQDLAPGAYNLTEVKAPNGFKLDMTPHPVTIRSGQLESTYVGNKAITNAPQEGPALPRSGGVGRDFFFIAGGGVMLLALAALALFGRKQQ